MRLSDLFLIKQEIELFLQTDSDGNFLKNLESTEFFQIYVDDEFHIAEKFDSFLSYWKHIYEDEIIFELLKLRDKYKELIEETQEFQIKNQNFPIIISSLVEPNQIIEGEVIQFNLRNKRLQKLLLNKTDISSGKNFVNFNNWITVAQESVNEYLSVNEAIKTFFNNKLTEINQKVETATTAIESFDSKIENFNKKISSFYDLVTVKLNEGIPHILSLPDHLGYHLALTVQESRVNIIESDTREQVSAKIRAFTDWKYPCLEIGPGNGTWTDNLVGSDPLYLIDIHKEYVDKTLSNFTDIFAKRIRTYFVGEMHGKETFDYSELPTDQIGLIFSWAVLDFHPIEDIAIFLQQCSRILRPGGTLIFSYNDCEYLEGMRLFEKKEKTYMTKNMLVELSKKSSLDVESFHTNKNQNNFWVVIKKSGTLKSIKKSQPRSVINTRSGRERLDRSHPISYNNQQIARIKQLAIQLNVDTEENILLDKVDPHKLMELIEIARITK